MKIGDLQYVLRWPWGHLHNCPRCQMRSYRQEDNRIFWFGAGCGVVAPVGVFIFYQLAVWFHG